MGSNLSKQFKSKRKTRRAITGPRKTDDVDSRNETTGNNIKILALSNTTSVPQGMRPYLSDLTDLHPASLDHNGCVQHYYLYDRCGTQLIIPHSRWEWYQQPDDAKILPTSKSDKTNGIWYYLNPAYPPMFDDRFFYDLQLGMIRRKMYHNVLYTSLPHDGCASGRVDYDSYRKYECRMIEDGRWVSRSYWRLYADLTIARLVNGRLIILASKGAGVNILGDFVEIPVIVIDEAPTWIPGGENITY